MKRYDRSRIRQEIYTVTATIKDLKKRRSESHQPNFKPDDYWALFKAKRKATILCCLSASLRGRLHHLKTIEDQNKYLAKNEDSLKIFERVEEAAA